MRPNCSLSAYFHLVFTLPRPIAEAGVKFTWKDYRIEGPDRYKTMTLPTGEFIRRFLTHVLPKGLHRIRHYGLFAGWWRRRHKREGWIAGRPPGNPSTACVNPIQMSPVLPFRNATEVEVGRRAGAEPLHSAAPARRPATRMGEIRSRFTERAGSARLVENSAGRGRV